jgi:hypothetical protein
VQVKWSKRVEEDLCQGVSLHVSSNWVQILSVLFPTKNTEGTQDIQAARTLYFPGLRFILSGLP